MENPVGWVRGVAARKLLDGHRRAAHWRRLVPVVGHDPATVTDGCAGFGGELMAAVIRLPVRQRAVVVLHYLADWSISDVAAALGVAPGTVKSTLSDARAALRADLAEGGCDV